MKDSHVQSIFIFESNRAHRPNLIPHLSYFIGDVHESSYFICLVVINTYSNIIYYTYNRGMRFVFPHGFTINW